MKSHTGKTQTQVAAALAAAVQLAGLPASQQATDRAAYARDVSAANACCRRMGSAVTGMMERSDKDCGTK